MNKIKVLVLEDDKHDIALLEAALHDEHFEITAVANKLDTAIQLYHTLTFDIVIIDIFLEGKPLGIDFAEKISASPIKKPFVFLTSSVDKNIFRLAKTFDPYSYLIKPFNRLELLFAIELSLENFLHTERAFANQKPVFYNDAFFVRDGESIQKIKSDEINYISIDGPYCNMNTENGNFILQTSLAKLLNELPKTTFLQSHRNYIVNINKIERIYPKDNLILLSSGEKVLMSRRRKDLFFQKYKLLK
ncbi:LytTR family DNA-binding domain-containing protein [Winogradskyella sp.]|uniref:LytR/AlgR family response regulator transcription factor n=1 Tax=Winogradskyella sp. TaxID=1883156 RepID=UPI00261BD68F|nr:response regulator transcription factor [Winogradskyella sp.]